MDLRLCAHAVLHDRRGRLHSNGHPRSVPKPVYIERLEPGLVAVDAQLAVVAAAAVVPLASVLRQQGFVDSSRHRGGAASNTSRKYTEE